MPKLDEKDKRTFGQRFMDGLTQGGLAVAEGLTAAGGNRVPYYQNYMENQARQTQLGQEAQKQYQDFQLKKHQQKLNSRGNYVIAGVDGEGNPIYSQAPGKVANPNYMNTTGDRGDASAIADGVVNGTQPPIMTGLYGKSAAVRAILSKKGFDLAQAQKDWTATNKFIGSLNSTQQVRLGQAISSVRESIPVLQGISADFERTGWTPTNYAQLKAAMTGTDPTKRDIATKYTTQINVMKDELGQAFMAGGVPTDKAFKMADEILNPLYGTKQLGSALEQLNKNLNIRETAIGSQKPRTVSGSGAGDSGTTGGFTKEQALAELARRRNK